MGENWGTKTEGAVLTSFRSSLEIKIGFHLPGKRMLGW